MQYTVRRTDFLPTLNGDWDDPAWQNAEQGRITHFRPESSDHRPEVQFCAVHDDHTICGGFRVRDRYVRCVHEGFQAAVCRDSCVEFFVKPHRGPGYFNFEFSCGGSLLATYVLDWRRVGDEDLARVEELTAEQGRAVTIWHSLPARVEPEITSPTKWTLQFAIPVAILEAYTGSLRPLSGRQWTANFYKCGDHTSHPHWGSWAPVSALNFHLPECFQPLGFE